jgi:hypothetical protein
VIDLVGRGPSRTIPHDRVGAFAGVLHATSLQVKWIAAPPVQGLLKERERVRTVPGSRSTPRNRRHTARWTSPPGTSTTSPSPATRSTHRTARASSPGVRTGSTPAGRASRVAARCATSRPTASNGRPARHATRAQPPPRSARSRSPPRSPRSSDAGWANIQGHEQALLERLLTGLDAIADVRTNELWEPGHDRVGVGVVSFNIDGLDPALLAAALGAEHGRTPLRSRRACSA